MVKLYQYLTTVFTYKAFGILPEKIEIISLLEGNKHDFYPDEQEFIKGLTYLEFIKDSIQKPEYFKEMKNNECARCHLNNQCIKENFPEKEIHFTLPNNHELH